MRNISVLLVCLGMGWTFAGCEEETGNSETPKPVEDSAFSAYCEDSGGAMEGERCVCAGETCNKYVVCSDATGKCANGTVIQVGNEVFDECTPETPVGCIVDANGDAILKKCIKGYLIEEKCERGCNSAGNGCAASFGDLCEGTGGVLSDDGRSCVCGGMTCPQGDLCVSSEAEMMCASAAILGDKCIDGDTKCVNGIDDRGEMYACIDGRWVRDTDEEGKEVRCAGSCDKQMKACGESGCVNYNIECRNDLLLEEAGAIVQCQFGKWQILRECADGVSCKDDHDCGECKNGNTKCEDHDVDGIMNKNCDSKGNCETDANGKVKNYPANIGVLLVCDSGEWSDPDDLTKSKYCPESEGTFQKYMNMDYPKWTTLMTLVYKVYKGVLVHDDYHYSSCHNADGKSECGTCNNHFNICSDEKVGGVPQGHLYKCQNGVLVSNMMCSKKTCDNTHIQCNN